MPLSPSIPAAFAPKQFITAATLFIGYFLAALVGMYFYRFGHTFPGLIWPAAGIAVAGLYIGGRNLWPAIALASFLASLSLGSNLLASILSAVGVALEAYVAAEILHRLNLNPLINRLRDAIIITLTALLPTVIGPTISVLNRVFISHSSAFADFGNVWGPYWLGHIASVMVVMPLLVRWIARPHFRRTSREFAEIGIAFVALIAINVIIFWFGIASFFGISLVYFLLLPLFWIALRLGPRFMTVGLFLLAAIDIFSVIYAHRVPSVSTGLFQAEQFIVIISFIFLVLVAAVEERKDAIKLMQRELNKLSQALVRIKNEDNAKNEFIAILAHELRNPLAPIVSSLELIEYEDLSEGARHWLRIISDHTKTVRRLLDDLLDISRISQHKLRLRKEIIDLRALLTRALESSEPLFRTRKHRVTFNNCEYPLMVDADPVRIEQIFVNLLNNAARYTESGGSITIACKKRESTAVISIKDTGIGIASHMLARIFEPFVQAGTEKQGFAGLGIGLSLTKQLVDMHGGSIEAKSRGIGKGSEFIVRLPLMRTMKRAATLPSSVNSLFPMSETYRILIVDDNEAAAEGLGKLLEYRGHDTRLIYQGGQVIAAVRDFEPDVVLLDIGLPDVDGYDVARRLKNETESEAILIALTGYGQDEDRQRAKEAGFDYHLTKPVGLRDIENVLVNRQSAKL